MKKPEIFFQFDEQEYRSQHYEKGYFDYRKDGYGPVFTNPKEVAKYIEQLLGNDCEMEERYRSRVDSFFAFRDQKNCERNFNAIMNLR